MLPVATQQIRLLIRQKTVMLLFILLVGITIASSFIGWSSRHTITAVYDQTVNTLKSSGKSIPPNPFADAPSLSILKNMVIYIPLVGALLAIIMGHTAITSDRVSGVSKLIFSRPLARRQYLGGKLLGISGVLFAVIIVCLLTSLVSLLVITRQLSSTVEIFKLLLFYIISFAYLFLFALTGATAALMTRSQSLALLGALGVWIVISFVLPQFTSGVSPIASLNPVAAPVDSSQTAFFRTTRLLKPFSISEQYKATGSQLLDAIPRTEYTNLVPQLLPLGASLIGVACLGWARMKRLTVYEESAHD